jgi:beta-lactam-binding protein with PASTA domain
LPDPTTPPPDDTWPAAEDPTVVARDDTLVGAPPPGPGVPPPEGPPPDRRIGAGMLLAIGAIVLVAAGILIAYLLTHDDDKNANTTTVITTTPSTTVPPKVAVPRFVGMKEQDALVRAGQVGLKPKEVFQPSKKPKGIVLSQNPEEGTEVPRNSEVKLVIDSNAKPATTTTAPTTTAATTTAPTTTAATTTAATTTTTTTRPTTTAPAQPTSATVPDVTGQTESAAATAFGNAGILASVVFVPGQSTLGTVAAQGKPANTTVPYHSHVQLNISRGPNDNPNQSVPNVVGQTLQQAVSTLNGRHLRLIYLKYPVTSRTQAGKVVQQSPLGGGQAPENAQVIVYLGSFKTR